MQEVTVLHCTVAPLLSPSPLPQPKHFLALRHQCLGRVSLEFHQLAAKVLYFVQLLHLRLWRVSQEKMPSPTEKKRQAVGSRLKLRKSRASAMISPLISPLGEGTMRNSIGLDKIDSDAINIYQIITQQLGQLSEKKSAKKTHLGDLGIVLSKMTRVIL